MSHPRRSGDDEHAHYASLAHYRFVAERSDATDFTVLMLHGLGGTSEQLWPLFEASPLARLATDARGHGRTGLIGAEGAFTFAGLARDQLALLDALGIGRVAIAGVSMGAGVAVALARSMPQRVAGLLLIRPAWLDQPYPPNLAAHVTAGQLLRAHDIATAKHRFEESPEYQSVAAISAAAAASLLGQFDDEQARVRSVRLRQMPGSVPFQHLAELAELAELGVPVTLVGAESDPAHPAEMAQAWATAIRGSQHLVLPSRDDDSAGYDSALHEAARTFCAHCVEEGGHD